MTDQVKGERKKGRRFGLPALRAVRDAAGLEVGDLEDNVSRGDGSEEGDSEELHFD